MATPFHTARSRNGATILPPELVEIGLEELSPQQLDGLADEFAPLDIDTFVSGEEFVATVSAYLLRVVGREKMVRVFIARRYESGMRRQ